MRRELRPALNDNEMMLWELEGLKVHLALRLEESEQNEGAEVTPATEQRMQATAESSSFGVGVLVGDVTGAIPREELTGRSDLGNDLLEVSLVKSVDSDDDGGDVADADADADTDADAARDTVLVPFVPQIVVDVRLNEGLVLLDPPGRWRGDYGSARPRPLCYPYAPSHALLRALPHASPHAILLLADSYCPCSPSTDGLLDLIQPKRQRRIVIRGLLPARAESLQESRT